jgi:endonuclease YncB( thermonuclease family)
VAPAAQNPKAPATAAPREPTGTGSVSKPPAEATVTRAASSEPVGALTGVPEVVDTATLRIDGKVVRLFGVEWARGGQGDDLTRYLRGREVACELAKTPDVYRCKVEAQDLSKVILFNGGGRATADATPELAAAENHAKTDRLGVWRK